MHTVNSIEIAQSSVPLIDFIFGNAFVYGSKILVKSPLVLSSKIAPSLLTLSSTPFAILCRVKLEGTRLLVLEAADQLDRLGNKKARETIAMARLQEPNMALLILDMPMQVHGAGGLSSDTVLAHLWATARTF
ncbi:putative acyl-CoA dehydrogenase IBR3, partial [Cucurbita argyrosperma subsp. sororia]